MVMRTTAFAVLLLWLCGCKPAEDSRSKAIIGAVLIDGAGGPPMSNSVVLTIGDRIAQAGRHGEIPVSSEAGKVDGAGRFIVPELIDIYRQAIEPAAARRQVLNASGKPAMLHVWTSTTPPQDFDGLMEAARGANLPIAGHPVTQADALLLVQSGVTALIGMIRDTDRLDPGLVTRLRDLRIVYAPALSAIGPGGELETARRNTQHLFAAGVPMAVATGGGDAIRECELMVQAGVPPLDIIVAATQNGARALRLQDDRGTLQPGKRADLLLLRANPGEDIRNLRRLDRRMANGEWK